ncbi:MAG: c-type cytochrome [Betaproteobacteria bacterium]|nr:MAG: c-type cytochrome [Betaproteobacteria bacterium]
MTRFAKYSLLALLATWLIAASAYAQENVQGRNWSGACTGCHGTEGRSQGAIPAIAGIDKAKFVELMTAFREGKQSATIMHQHAKGLSDEQIDALGDYFASRQPQ